MFFLRYCNAASYQHRFCAQKVQLPPFNGLYFLTGFAFQHGNSAQTGVELPYWCLHFSFDALMD